MKRITIEQLIQKEMKANTLCFKTLNQYNTEKHFLNYWNYFKEQDGTLSIYSGTPMYQIKRIERLDKIRHKVLCDYRGN